MHGKHIFQVSARITLKYAIYEKVRNMWKILNNSSDFGFYDF